MGVVFLCVFNSSSRVDGAHHATNGIQPICTFALSSYVCSDQPLSTLIACLSGLRPLRPLLREQRRQLYSAMYECTHLYACMCAQYMHRTCVRMSSNVRRRYSRVYTFVRLGPINERRRCWLGSRTNPIQNRHKYTHTDTNVRHTHSPSTHATQRV